METVTSVSQNGVKQPENKPSQLPTQKFLGSPDSVNNLLARLQRNVSGLSGTVKSAVCAKEVMSLADCCLVTARRILTTLAQEGKLVPVTNGRGTIGYRLAPPATDGCSTTVAPAAEPAATDQIPASLNIAKVRQRAENAYKFQRALDCAKETSPNKGIEVLDERIAQYRKSLALLEEHKAILGNEEAWVAWLALNY